MTMITLSRTGPPALAVTATIARAGMGVNM